jgi:starch synthase
MSSDLKIGIVTKEWPPQVYGGAGVHVVQLTEALRSVSGISVEVHCFGVERSDGAFGYETPKEFASANPALQAIATDLAIADNLSKVQLVHSHTWYANMAGHTASLLYGIPHIVSAHSL